MKFTPSAKRFWEAIAPDLRLRILNNVWCVQCMKSSSMGNVTGRIEKGMLTLTGVCTRCGGVVARLVEPD
jgi:hypothetical protein